MSIPLGLPSSSLAFRLSPRTNHAPAHSHTILCSSTPLPIIYYPSEKIVKSSQAKSLGKIPSHPEKVPRTKAMRCLRQLQPPYGWMPSKPLRL